MSNNKFHATIIVKCENGEACGYNVSDKNDLQDFIDMVKTLTGSDKTKPTLKEILK